MRLFLTLLLLVSVTTMFSAKGIEKVVKNQTSGGGYYTEDVLDDSYLLEGGFESGEFVEFTHNDETSVGIMFHVSEWNAYGSSGTSWWMSDPELGNDGGYADGWYQVLDSDAFTVSGTNPTLSFYHSYNIEDPAVYNNYDGWDGVNLRITTDGGLTWEVITNTSPAYNCTSMYSFGNVHGEGEGVPGWGGSSDWTNVTVDLSSYSGKTVKLRWAFASDGSFSTADDATMFGYQVDDIVVSTTEGELFSNNGTENGLTPSNNAPVGADLWSVVSTSGLGGAATGSYFASCNNESNTYVPNMVNTLTSPWVELPSVINTAYVDFKVRGSFSDNDVFPAVDHFGYYIQVNGESFRRYASNLDQDPNGDSFVYSDAPATWALFSESYATGLVDVSQFIGEEIRVILEFSSDEDTPIGEGVNVDDITVYTPDTVPVEFTTFTAAQSGSKVKLEWATATEINNKGFEVERSVNGSEWRVVGFVEGHGTVAQSKNYNFTDNINGISGSNVAYRLKQIDYSGAFDYSNEIELGDFLPTEYSVAQNYPNPFNPSTTISFAIPADNYVSLKVYNLLGQEVASIVDGNLAAGSYEYSFDASQLASGMYLYVLNSGANKNSSEFTSVNKMMLMK